MSPKSARKSNNKRAFDADAGFGRNTLWTARPEDLCLIGGKSLPLEERGKLDTDDGDEHLLYDPRILEPLAETFVNNIDALGVDTPILIAKIDGVAVVIFGKTRVRAARVANKRRKARGEPLISIDCKIKRGTTLSLFIAMVVENEQRRNDDIPAKIAKFRRLQNKGVSLQDCAMAMGVGVPTLKGWDAYTDHALPETKKAAESGRLSYTAAATIAKAKEPDKQREALKEALLTEGKVSRRVAKLAAKRGGGVGRVGVTDKKTLRSVLSVVKSTVHPTNMGKEALGFWSGIETALLWAIGEEGVDTRLTAKYDEAVALLKTQARAKQQAKTAKAAKKAAKHIEEDAQELARRTAEETADDAEEDAA